MMNKKIFCLILGTIYLFQGMPKEVKADWTTIGTNIGSAIGAVDQHTKDNKKNKQNNSTTESSDEE